MGAPGKGDLPGARLGVANPHQQSVVGEAEVADIEADDFRPAQCPGEAEHQDGPVPLPGQGVGVEAAEHLAKISHGDHRGSPGPDPIIHFPAAVAP